MSALPQLALLPDLVPRLMALPGVEAVFLSGSLGRGGGDVYSDLDLRVAVDASFRTFLSRDALGVLMGGQPLALECTRLGPHAYMHHMILPRGLMVDLLCERGMDLEQTGSGVRLDGTPGDGLPPRRGTSKAWAPQPIEATAVGDLVQRFWITMHKHRRGIARAQDLVIWTGVHYSIADIMRLEFLQATGLDCGNLTRMGIYELSGVSEWLREHEDMALGAGLWPWEQDVTWTAAVSQLMDRGYACCAALGRTWDLPAHLAELADVVRAEWRRFAAARDGDRRTQ